MTLSALTLLPLQTALVQSKTMKGRIHYSFSVLDALIKVNNFLSIWLCYTWSLKVTMFEPNTENTCYLLKVVAKNYK